MSGFSEKLRLKGMAEEDLYFAKKDRELIAARRQLEEELKRRPVFKRGSVGGKSSTDTQTED